MKKFLYIALAAVCFACTPKPINEDTLFINDEQANELIQQGELLTINEFLDRYMTEEGNYLSDTTQYRTRAIYTNGGNTYYLFSIDTISKTEKPVYIRGRITTDDYAGNFYKNICIQQMVDGEQQALRISVDAGSVGGLYQIGQEILVRVDGLAIGRYANQPQLCVPSYNDNVYAYNATEKVGWAPGRIPMAIFKAHVQCIGKPDVSKLVYTEMTIPEFKNIHDVIEARKLDGMLIRINNVHYTGQYENNGSLDTCTTGDPEKDGNANVFAPTTGNIGYPQGRIISDGTNTTLVSSSEYAKFAHFYLPGANNEGKGVENCPNYTGTVSGIVGFYADNGSSLTRYGIDGYEWSVAIRSLDDLDLRDIEGNLWPRIEYSK